MSLFCPTIFRQVSVMTAYLPVFIKQGNIHKGDVAPSNTVKTRPDVREVLVGKSAVSPFPEM